MVELMVSITVLTVCFLGASVAHTTCLNLTESSRETNAAVAELQTEMETLLTLPIENIVGRHGQGAKIPKRKHPTLKNRDMTVSYPQMAGGNGQGNGQVFGQENANANGQGPGGGQGPIPDPLEIVLRSTWEDFAGRQRTIKLTCRKTR